MFYNAIVNGDCNGLGNGSIQIFPIDGVEPYTIDWYNPNLGVDTLVYDGDDSTRTGLSGGLYQIRINDSNTPPNDEIYVNLWISTGMCLSLETITEASCEGSNGMLSVTATTQNYPVTYDLYQLSGLNSTLISTSVADDIQIFDSLPSGIYYVIATDDGGCTGSTGTCVISDSGKFTFGLYTIDDSACTAGNTGAIYVTGLTGTAPYTYQWSNSPLNQPSLTGLTGGSYSVTVTDANNCSITESVVVSAATRLGIINFVNSSPTCFNNDGQVIVNISGGTPPFYYQFSNGENDIDGDRSYTYNNLVAGTYTVIVTDAALCVVSGSTTILTPNSFTSTSVVVKNSTCSNGSGSITVSGGGGQTPYIFELLDSNGTVLNTQNTSPSAIFNNLNSGTYTVTMTTQGGICTYTKTVVIENVQPFAVSATPIATTCGNQNGQVTVYVDTPGIYTYQVGSQIIANSTSQTATFTNLPAGFYNALVTDADPESESCTVKTSFIILSSTKTAFTLTSTSCGNGNEGTVTALITGGKPPYTFGWSSNVGSQTGIFLTGLTAGTYSLILTDSDGCVATKSISVSCSSNNSTYSLFNVCDSEFIENSGTKQGLRQMLNDGYEVLTSGETGCSLTAATFTILVNVGGTGYTSEFYNSVGILDYPTDTQYVTALRNLLDSIPGIGSIIINTESNTIQLSTDCLKALSDKDVIIRLMIDYGFCCDDYSPTPTPTTTCDCTYIDVTISEMDLALATGNSDVLQNNAVFVKYRDCNTNTLMSKRYTLDGVFPNDICAKSTSEPSTSYWSSNIQENGTSTADNNGQCCIAPTPTSTLTPTLTPTPILYYYLVDAINCCTGEIITNQLVYSVFPNINVGSVFSYATTQICFTITNSTPTISGSEAWGVGGPWANCTACLDFWGNCPTPTPTTGPTPTPGPTSTSTPTPTPTPTPGPTSTSTPTPTPTPTPGPTSTSTPTPSPTSTLTPTPTPTDEVSYVGYYADEFTCEYDPDTGVAIQCNLVTSSVEVQFPTTVTPLFNRYYAPNPGSCSGTVYYVTGNSVNTTGPIIGGVTAHNVCIDACQEECPL